VDDVNEFAENIAKGVKLTNAIDLANVNKLFDNMAENRASIFRLSVD
jgi:hypothetical protein